jgi:hypothetical protein
MLKATGARGFSQFGERMPNWAVQQMRVSLFSSDAMSLSEKHWKQLTGEDEAASRIAIAGGKQYSGKFLGGTFSVGFSSTRCDIILGYDGTLDDPTLEPKLPAYGNWEEISETFLTAVTPFIEGFEFPVVRLAFGALLLAPASSKEDAYSQMGKLLRSVKVDPVHMREFNYRVNWPQSSTTVSGLEVNRLTTWSASGFYRALMQLTGTEMSAAAASDLIHAVRLEMDHNTSQAHKEPFGKAIRIPILRELLSMARDNAKAGEHP